MTIHVIYHAEPSYWAEVPELSGFTAADENLDALSDRVRRVAEELYGAHVDLDESRTEAGRDGVPKKPSGARHFIGRPSQVDAIQYDGTNITSIVDWVNEHHGNAKVGYSLPGPDKVQPLFLYVHGKPIRVDSGAWVVRDNEGTFSAIPSNEFEVTYERAD